MNGSLEQYLESPPITQACSADQDCNGLNGLPIAYPIVEPICSIPVAEDNNSSNQLSSAFQINAEIVNPVYADCAPNPTNRYSPNRIQSFKNNCFEVSSLMVQHLLISVPAAVLGAVLFSFFENSLAGVLHGAYVGASVYAFIQLISMCRALMRRENNKGGLNYLIMCTCAAMALIAGIGALGGWIFSRTPVGVYIGLAISVFAHISITLGSILENWMHSESYDRSSSRLVRLG